MDMRFLAGFVLGGLFGLISLKEALEKGLLDMNPFIGLFQSLAFRGFAIGTVVLPIAFILFVKLWHGR